MGLSIWRGTGLNDGRACGFHPVTGGRWGCAGACVGCSRS